MDLLASSHTNECKHYLILENLLSPGTLGLNTFNQPRPLQESFVFPLHLFIPNSSFQVSGGTCHRSIQTSDSH